MTATKTKVDRRCGQYGPEWAAIRRTMKKRAGYRCQACGGDAKRRKPLQVHHVVPFAKSRDNGYANLVVLCYLCHLRVHRLYREYACATARQFRHVCAAARQVIKAEQQPTKRRIKFVEYLDREIVPWAFA